jgi:tripartite-type tricarboxylate transporter receptor subunit TctC
MARVFVQSQERVIVINTVFFVTVAGVALSLVAAIVAPVEAQQTYPNQPIRIIVPFPPGGSVDPLARLVGQKLAENWGQQVVIDNRPGGNSIIGTQAAVKSKPDGYTLLYVTGTHVINANLLATPYDAIKDFAPVATLITTELLLVVHPSLPVATLREFITYAKSRPGELNYASSGTATSIHLKTELFSLTAGVKMNHVPYKGAAPAVVDLIGGRVQLVFQVPMVVIPHANSGKLRAIAVSGAKRLTALPQVPTLTEAGLPGVDMSNWNGLLAPAGTPKDIIDKLNAEIARILALPDVRSSLLSQGNEPTISTSEQFAALIRSDLARTAKVINAASIKIEQ